MDKPLLTFEQCLDYLEKESGHKFLNWQKEFFRTIYDYPELYMAPTRQDGIIALNEARITLDKLLGANEINENNSKIMDCNNCEYLNITEAEQNIRGNHMPHICTKYNQRVLHRATNKIHNEYIYPCDKCLKENKYGIQ